MTDRIASLVARHFAVSGGQLHLGGVAVGTLAERYGTPLYVYDAHVLDRKLRLLRTALTPEFTIAYSVKANPNPAIVEYFLAKQCALEIASAGEFHCALRAGCPPARILFAGPGKTDAELELVLKEGIGEIHAESLGEIQRIIAIADRLAVQAPVAVRVNPGQSAQGGAMRMGGKPAPFGIDEEALDPALDVLLSAASIEFRGVHLFAGTQILDPAVLAAQYRTGVEIAERVAHRSGRPLHTVDFGGGLGIPYFDGESELDMERLGQDIGLLMADVRGRAVFSGTRFVVEPGRYLVGEAGVYVARVIDVKVSRGKRFLILDGGMNHHLAASGNLGQVIKRNFPIGLVNRLDRPSDETVDVVGPLCTPLDTLARDARLPAARVGDLIGIFQSGAYGRTASPLSFLSHPAPPEVLVGDRTDRLIRRRGGQQDVFSDCPSPAGEAG
ncbi:MAG: type III PLP-dependent enzyme [Candidatus Rokuibacteriota bacterium]